MDKEELKEKIDKIDKTKAFMIGVGIFGAIMFVKGVYNKGFADGVLESVKVGVYTAPETNLAE